MERSLKDVEAGLVEKEAKKQAKAESQKKYLAKKKAEAEAAANAAKQAAGKSRGDAVNFALYGLTCRVTALALVLTPPRNLTDAKTDCYQIRLHHHGNPWANCETCS